MAFPGATQNVRNQIKEAGGQPLPIGDISNAQVLRRDSNTIIGTAACVFGTAADPNTVEVGYVGQFYKDTSGGSTWVKQTGNGTNTGWIAF